MSNTLSKNPAIDIEYNFNDKDYNHFNKIFWNIDANTRLTKYNCDGETSWLFFVGNTPCFKWQDLQNDDATGKYARHETPKKLTYPSNVSEYGCTIYVSDNLVCYDRSDDIIQTYSAELNDDPVYLKWGDKQTKWSGGVAHESEGAYRIVALRVPFNSALVDLPDFYARLRTNNHFIHPNNVAFEKKLAAYKLRNNLPLPDRTLSILSADELREVLKGYLGGTNITLMKMYELIDFNPEFFKQYYNRMAQTRNEKYTENLTQLTIPYTVLLNKAIDSISSTRGFPEHYAAIRSAITEFSQGDASMNGYMYGRSGRVGQVTVKPFHSTGNGFLCFAELIYNFFKTPKNIHDNYDIFLHFANLHGNNGYKNSNDTYARIKEAFDGLMDVYCRGYSDANAVLRCSCIASKTDERFTSTAHAYPTCFNDTCSRSGYKFDDPNRGSCASYCNTSINVDAKGVAILKNISIIQNCMNIGNASDREGVNIAYSTVMNDVTDQLIKSATDALKAYVFAHIYTKTTVIDGLSQEDVTTKLAVNLSYHDNIVKEIDMFIALNQVQPTKSAAFRELISELGTARDASRTAVSYYLDTGKFQRNDAENETVFAQANAELIRKTGTIQSILDNIEKLLIEARDYMTKVYGPDKEKLIAQMNALIAAHRSAGGDVTTAEILRDSVQVSNISLTDVGNVHNRIKKIADDHLAEVARLAREAAAAEERRIRAEEEAEAKRKEEEESRLAQLDAEEREREIARIAAEEAAAAEAAAAEAAAKRALEEEAERMKIPPSQPEEEDKTEVVNVDPPKVIEEDGWSQWLIWIIAAVIVLFVVGLVGGIAIFSMRKSPKLVPQQA